VKKWIDLSSSIDRNWSVDFYKSSGQACAAGDLTFRESMRALRFVEKTVFGVTAGDDLERRFGGVFRRFSPKKNLFWRPILC